MITIRSSDELARLEEASRVVLETLEVLEKAVAPGVTTEELDRIAVEEIRRRNAKPAFLNYRGFPKTICTSVNDEVVHGIPGSRSLKEGDIVGIDCGAVVQGYYGDAARTLPVGRVDAARAKLMEVTRQALEAGIAAAQPGGRVSDIGAAVEAVAVAHGYGVVREFVGHGVGTRSTRSRRCPTTGLPAAGARSAPGWSSRSSRCSTSARGRSPSTRTAGRSGPGTGRRPRTSRTRSRSGLRDRSSWGRAA